VRNPGSTLRRPIVGLAVAVLVGSALAASPAAAAPSASDPSIGPSVLASKLEEQFGTLAGKLRAETAGMGPADRLQAVAHAMTAEGYMAEAEVADATFGTLIEHNCAIQAVAERFPELCAAEARFLEAVLGASVERRGYILAGCGACEYHVRFGAPARAAEESV